MEKGKYIIDLAHYIPHRNINFYIDTYRAMSAVNLEDIDNGEMRKLKSLIIDRRFQAKPQDAIKMVITYNKGNENNELSILKREENDILHGAREHLYSEYLRA